MGKAVLRAWIEESLGTILLELAKKKRSPALDEKARA